MKIKMLDKTLKINSNKKFFNEDIYVQIPNGYLKPEGTLNITTTNEYNVTNYSKAKIVEPNLIPENISDGITILGVTGTLVDVKKTEQWILTLNDGTEITKDVYIK